VPDPLAADYDLTRYPYTSGYAQLADVQARVNAGTWDASKPNAAPTVAQVQTWLRDASAQVDATLAVRGYYVPLRAQTAFTAPAGATSFNGIVVQGYQHLRSLVADYVAGMVQATRHGGSRSTDTDRDAWLKRWQQQLTAIRDGKDSLWAFGADGTFAPALDHSTGGDSGTFNDEATLMDPSNLEEPVFGRHNQF
jgi:hypothetical protein